MNYKQTLNLPKTDFPMKASLALREPEQLKKWEAQNIYHQIRNSRKDGKQYILHDGPPYANGDIHVGHALNKILKDFVIKYKTLKGYDAPYTPGWDCHGLPIEHQLLKKKKKTTHEVDQIEFRKEAKDFALQWMGTQRAQFKRLGIFGDWQNPYLTLNPVYEATILRNINDIHKAGHMYKAKKPVYWSYACETALAEAEVEYADHTSPSVYVRFNVENFDNKYLVIWTTTPWTLPANLATAVHKDFIYVEIEVNQEIYIVAKDLSQTFIEKCNLQNAKFGKEYTGQELEGTKYYHPFLERKSPVILSPYVTLETGTGLVHTAPGHGQEDYIVGQKYGLEILSPVNEKGCFTKEAGICEGMMVFKANEPIIELLKEKNALMHKEDILHSYPHCWRSKKPIIFRATEQWFISMDNENLREKSLQNIKDVKWIPDYGYARINAMVQNRPDWCISRQRLWGVPIPGLECKSCNKSFFDHDFVDQLTNKVLNNGVNVWFEQTINEIAEKELKCPYCSSTSLSKESNIVDVWFESGVSYDAVIKSKNLNVPVDLYLEGSDQHRGWFQSSLMTASANALKAPFKTVLTHGFVVDAEGKKMSKSMGNVVDPQKITKQYGADILRIWVASTDYSLDIKISDKHFPQIADAYRKVRNTFRFLLGNINDFNFKQKLDFNDLLDLDKWIIIKLNDLIISMEKDLNEFKFYRAWNKAYNFCNNELSSIYLNIQKDVLYCAGKESLMRVSSQSAMSEIIHVLAKVLFPFISYTCEEVWNVLNAKEENHESIALQLWPDIQEIKNSAQIRNKYEKLFPVRELVFKKIESLVADKVIKNSLQAEIIIICNSQEEYDYYLSIKEELKRFFVSSGVEIQLNESAKEILYDVKAKDGKKCDRCWVIFNEKDTANTESDICPDCNDVIKNLKIC